MYDVIVAGAGPAGSTAARVCAEHGLSVLLLDKAEFPRDKPCGGGVNIRAARLLPFSVESVTERVIYGMRISVSRRREYTRYASEPLTYLTQRRRLDAYLAERAEMAGARFLQRTAVREIERMDRRVIVRAGREAFEGRTLLAADGANGPTAGMAGIDVRRSKEIALEGNISPAGGLPVSWRDVYGIDVGSVPGGYGWLFPKGDHLNIGVGGISRVGPSLRRHLDSLTRFYGFDPHDFWGLRGHPLPVRIGGSAAAAGNAAAIGDAAGLLDPLSGEGIFAAIWSGTVASRRVLEYLNGRASGLEGFTDDVEAEIQPELDTSRQLHSLFHLAPPVWAALVERSDRAWSLLGRLLTGDASYTHIKARSRLLEVGIVHGSALANALHTRRSSRGQGER